MNWGEIKQAVLHKLDGPDQDLAEEYKSRMIPAANEGRVPAGHRRKTHLPPGGSGGD